MNTTTTHRIDWGRLGYWLLKYLFLAAALAALVAVIWAIGVALIWVVGIVAALGCWAWRHFYSIAIVLLLLLILRVLRAVARYFEAKANAENEENL